MYKKITFIIFTILIVNIIFTVLLFNTVNSIETPDVIVDIKIANITKMTWFSTEIAIDKKLGALRFVAIDYVNDQCDMEAKSESKDGVPDHIVKFTAYSIIHAADQLIQGRREKLNKKYAILLRKNDSIGMRGLGFTPGLLTQITS